jgi:hypothetical protein
MHVALPLSEARPWSHSPALDRTAGILVGAVPCGLCSSGSRPYVARAVGHDQAAISMEGIGAELPPQPHAGREAQACRGPSKLPFFPLPRRSGMPIGSDEDPNRPRTSGPSLTGADIAGRSRYIPRALPGQLASTNWAFAALHEHACAEGTFSTLGPEDPSSPCSRPSQVRGSGRQPAGHPTRRKRGSRVRFARRRPVPGHRPQSRQPIAPTQ